MTFFAVQGAHTRPRRSARAARSPCSRRDLPPPSDTPPWETAADRATLPLEAVEFVFDSTPIAIAAPIVDGLRARVVSRRAGRCSRPSLDLTAPHPRRLHVRSEGDDRGDAAGGGLRVAARRLSGLRAPGDRLPALARHCRRATSAATWRPCRRRARRGWSAPTRRTRGWRSTARAPAGFDVDPTNNLLPSDTHITVAWGRDYSDVSPIRGVILGGGAHALRVQVDVVRLRLTSHISPVAVPCATGSNHAQRFAPMKVFHCDHCGHLLFFENTHCVRCGQLVAYLPDLAIVGSLDPNNDQTDDRPAPGDRRSKPAGRVLPAVQELRGRTGVQLGGPRRRPQSALRLVPADARHPGPRRRRPPAGLVSSRGREAPA